MRKVLIILIITLTFVGAFCKGFVVLENFDDNSNDWANNYDDENKYLNISNGYYYFEHKRDSQGWTTSLPFSFDTSGDFMIDTSIRKVSGVNNNGYGILWGRKDSDNEFSFVISGDGHFKLSKDEKGDTHYYYKWTKSEHINQGNDSINRLSIMKWGASIYCYINEVIVASIPFEGFFGTKAGFTIFDAQKIAVDDFKIYQYDTEQDLSFKQIVFEDFQDNSRDWANNYNDSNKTLQIEDGKYYFEHKRESKGWTSTLEFDLDYKKDFFIETYINKISGIQNNGVGLIFGREDSDNEMSFFYDGQGYFMVKEERNSNVYDHVKWTKHASIKEGNGALNKLAVSRQNNDYNFYINDQKVHSMPADLPPGKRIGFIVYNNQKIAIENLYMRYLLDGEGYPIQKHYSDTRSDILTHQKTKSRNVQKFPPDLYIENLRFVEGSGNNALDGLETGYITFDLNNRGRGDAFSIEVDLTAVTSSENVSFQAKTVVSSIESKTRNNVSIPVSADIAVENQTREFRIEVSEQNGFDTDPATISFETLAFASPDLRIEQVAIDDNEDAEGEGDSYGNGNSIIEPNESIEVTAYVQNFGDGDASQVQAKVKLNTKNRDITYPDEGHIYDLSTITSGDYTKVKFYFYTSRRYKESKIPFSILLTEATGNFTKEIDLNLKLGERTKNVVDVQVSKIHHNKRKEMKSIENVFTQSDVDQNIPVINSDGSNTLAIILGIEEYKYAPKVDFAANDARSFYKYCKSMFGIPESNIYLKINDGATAGEFRKIFAEDGWIARRIQNEETKVLIYYSGHGAPDLKSKKGYLIPHDIDPNYASTGVSLDDIYSSLAKLEAGEITLFLDACFSGESRSHEMLVAGIRPISIKVKNPILTSTNLSVFTASTGDQYSTSYPVKQHGLFTYFLLKGLKGDAKGNDSRIELNELHDYLSSNVSRTAGYLDKEQNPTFIGSNPDKTIIKF